MMADQEQGSMSKWLWRTSGRDLLSPELGLLALFLVLLITIFYGTSADYTGAFPATFPGTLPAPTLARTDLGPSRQPLELKGSLLADSQQGQVMTLHFVLALAPQAPPLDLTAPLLTLRYQDATQQMNKLPWTWRFQSGDNGNRLLEEGERVELTVPIMALLPSALGANTPFRLELAAPQRLLFSLQRTTPPLLTPLLDLQ